MSDPILRLTTSQSPVFLVNSRYLLFCAIDLFNRRSFSLSYEANLQSSFNIVLLCALVYSTRLSVSIYSTVLYFRSALSRKLIYIYITSSSYTYILIFNQSKTFLPSIHVSTFLLGTDSLLTD
jgi:hypothetical protein